MGSCCLKADLSAVVVKVRDCFPHYTKSYVIPGFESCAHTSKPFKFQTSSHLHSEEKIPKITDIACCYIITFHDMVRYKF